MRHWKRKGREKICLWMPPREGGQWPLQGVPSTPAGPSLTSSVGGRATNTVIHKALRKANVKQIINKVDSLLPEQSQEYTLDSDLYEVGRVESMETTPLSPSDFVPT